MQFQMTFSVAEVGLIIGCSKGQIYALIADNAIRSVKIRGMRRITRQSIHDFLDSLEDAAGSQC
jgi:excisionase family DNA binding protein